MSSHLEMYGWTASWDAAFKAVDGKDLVPGRVIGEEKESYSVMLASGERTGVLAGRLRIEEEYPAVGDWVGVLDPGEGMVRIDALLPRQSSLARKEAGNRVREQVICANVDLVLLVTSLNADFNVRRITRYLTAISSGGAKPVLVLSKLDKSEDTPRMLKEAKEAAPGVPVLTLSALSGEGLEELNTYLEPAKTFLLVGSSGVGKSTLVNRLLGRSEQAVRTIREDDARGRHTTTGRRLFVLPNGALLVDTPGMRELQLWEEESPGLEDTFEDIAALMRQCRFGDCSHSNEPGCALNEALESGTLTEERYGQYEKLSRELDFLKRRKDKGAQREEERKWRKISMDFRSRRKLEDKL